MFIGQIIGLVITIKLIWQAANSLFTKKDTKKIEVKESKYFCPTCLVSFIVIVIIAILIYFNKPIDSAYSIAKIRDDWGTLSGFVIMLVVVLESLVLCLKHYWIWIYISPFVIWFASHFEQYSSIAKFDEFFINGILFLFPIVPIVAIILKVRRNIRNHSLFQ